MLKDLNAMYAMGVPAESQIFLWAKLLTLTVRPPAKLYYIMLLEVSTHFLNFLIRLITNISHSFKIFSFVPPIMV